jgi:hypothetical protein
MGLILNAWPLPIFRYSHATRGTASLSKVKSDIPNIQLEQALRPEGTQTRFSLPIRALGQFGFDLLRLGAGNLYLAQP